MSYTVYQNRTVRSHKLAENGVVMQFGTRFASLPPPALKSEGSLRSFGSFNLQFLVKAVKTSPKRLLFEDNKEIDIKQNRNVISVRVLLSPRKFYCSINAADSDWLRVLVM